MLKKKFLSLIISFLLIISVFSVPANAWVQFTSPNAVKGSDYTDNPNFAQALDDLFAGDIDLYSDSARKKEVSMPLGYRISMNKQYYMYSTSKNTQTSGWTCYIYSNGAFNKLFGEYVHNGASLKNCYIAVGKGASKMTYNLLKNANIMTGAYIRTSPKSDGSYYGSDGHSMIILDYDSTHITYLEGNGDGKGLVRITKRTYSEFNSAQLSGKGRKITHIVQPTEEWFDTLYGNTPEDYTYTFSYNANGGTGSQANFTVPYNSEFTLNANGFSHNDYDFAGFNIKRNTDGKWLSKNGWSEDKDISSSNPRTVINSGQKIKFDESFITDSLSDISYTAYATWKVTPYEECSGVVLVSTKNQRTSYPLNSTVSFTGSVVEFTFKSGKTTRVTISENCSSTVSQTFRFNKRNYSFYIDGAVTKEGNNDCYIRLDSYKGAFTTVVGSKAISSTSLSGKPSAVWGENAQITLNYSDGTKESVKALAFTPLTEGELITGTILTDGNFYMDWNYSVTTGKTPTVSYPCGTSLPLTYGDINMDGTISTIDLAALKLFLSREYSGFCKAFLTCDINKDEKINTLDLGKIKLYLAGM